MGSKELDTYWATQLNWNWKEKEGLGGGGWIDKEDVIYVYLSEKWEDLFLWSEHWSDQGVLQMSWNFIPALQYGDLSQTKLI